MTRPNGITATWTWDADGRLVALVEGELAAISSRDPVSNLDPRALAPCPYAEGDPLGLVDPFGTDPVPPNVLITGGEYLSWGIPAEKVKYRRQSRRPHAGLSKEPPSFSGG